ncbi:MAG: cadmium-translocating P-type ATPase [Acidobacteriaceae bacterium]|nr:cadmium-translocating P-type ATPase [Acidobacteriaceae bacterium]
MQVDPQRATRSELAGKTYYFCCEGCKKKFEGKGAPAVASGTAEYTCPMHPEVRKTGPGACPKCGMALEPLEITGEDANPELADMQRRFWISAVLSAPLLAFMVLGWRGHAMQAGARWIELALATPVVIWGGLPFFARAWVSVSNRNLNMFTLIALGSGTGYVFSAVAAIAPWTIPSSFRTAAGELPLYFEPAAVIILLVLLGQILELRARAQTAGAIKSLLSLAPKGARLVEDNGERDIAIEQIEVGDRLRVRPGENIPADGVIVEGSSTVDESMISGESMPVDKMAGAPVTGGTLNTSGSFVMRAERVGSDTLLSQIVRLVSEAQRTRAPIQKLADKVAAYFVPAVVLCAAVTFAAWSVWGPAPRFGNALMNAIAVLIVACPCALGLATPMSIMVGTGRGAKAGILIRNAEALELLHRVDTVAMDKTGTLTEGRPKVVRVQALNGFSEVEVLQLAASLERASEHPLANAIVSAAEERGIGFKRVEEFSSSAGMGVTGRVSGRFVAVGNRGLVESAENHAQEGETSVFVGVDGRLAGAIALADPVKATARKAMERLHREKIRICMLTGDTRAVAERVASELGIDDIRAEILPVEKAQAILTLKAGGRVVAMAGDGVNDAPALAAADVGIAMSTGTDIAIESASVTLLHGDLLGVARAVRLSRATMRNIRQNLFFAFVYNMLGVPIAAGLLYPFFGLLLSPMIASLAMTFSSVSVIGNALRLRRLPL